MEVTHINNMNTHAILGGGAAQAFKTSNDAKLFEILSSSLYSNKKLAVVREIMCNAWDGNIAAGNQNKPIIVTVTDSEFSVKDCGPGIPKDKMADIYCVYGGSTKEHDGDQTGGFGLGSKAPFAYAKNFSVISSSEGIRSVWNISRGTQATNGIPDLRCMVSVPTEESGLTVTMPIDASDKAEFLKLVKDVAFLGGIFCSLNGQTQKRIDYTKLDDDIPFVTVPNGYFPPHLNADSKERQYYVKYGAVVYPIARDMVQALGLQFKIGRYNFLKHVTSSAILIAPPHSIGVMPNREGLEYTEKTKSTLRMMFESANKYLSTFSTETIDRLEVAYSPSSDEAFFETLSEHDVISALHNPQVLYKRYCERRGARYSHGYDAVLKWREVIVSNRERVADMLAYDFARSGHFVDEITARLIAKDPVGHMMKSRLYKEVVNKNPGIGKRMVELLKRGYSFRHARSRARHEICWQMRDILNKLNRDIPGIAYSFFSDAEPAEFRSFDWEESHDQSSSRSRGDRGFSRLMNHHPSGDLRNIPVILSMSEVAIRRRAKRDEKFRNTLKACIVVISRKKKDYQKTLAYLQASPLVKTVVDVASQDLIPPPIISTEKRYLIHFVGENLRTKLVTTEQPKHFIIAPANHLIPGVTGIMLNKCKTNIPMGLLRTLTYVYPDLQVVAGLGDAARLEEQGLTNVFQDIGETATAYFRRPENHETLLNKVAALSGYFTSYNSARILRFVQPSVLMEALGKKPTYFAAKADMPSVIHLFFALVQLGHVPKYGFQHIHRAANTVQEVFREFFGKELSDLMNDPMLDRFLDTIPNIYQKVDEETRPIFSAAILAAIQTAKLHQHLREKPQ